MKGIFFSSFSGNVINSARKRLQDKRIISVSSFSSCFSSLRIWSHFKLTRKLRSFSQCKIYISKGRPSERPWSTIQNFVPSGRPLFSEEKMRLQFMLKTPFLVLIQILQALVPEQILQRSQKHPQVTGGLMFQVLAIQGEPLYLP